MADVIVDRDSGNGMGFAFGLIVVLLLILALWFWGFPAMRGRNDTQIDVTQEQTVPAEGEAMPDTDMPTEVDVNVTGLPQY